MRSLGRICFLLAVLLCLAKFATAQTVTVQSITITGLKHTKRSIVTRELTFTQGDTLPQSDLGPILERNRNNLFNLGIFNEVIVNVSEWDTKLNTIDITIEVRESWYIYALPILDLADRNFNVWWTTYNHAFNRLNLGARLEWLNFSGHNDKVKAVLQFGYTPKQEIEYRFPYLNKEQSLGITTGFLHSANKEVSYATIDNQEKFVKLDDRILQEKWQGQVNMFYRPSIFIRYEFSVNYQHITMDEEVIRDYNPQLFRNGDFRHDVFTVRLGFEYDDRDIKVFPAKGIKAGISLDKTGWSAKNDENRLVTSIIAEWNTTSGRKFQHRVATLIQYSLSRSRPSYMYYEGLGSNSKYVSGYELYAIDGLDFLVGKYQVAFKLLDKKVRVGKIIPLEQFRRMPIKTYLTMMAETGYVHDPFTGAVNSLSNRWLYGGGPGLSLLLYHNFLFQLHYSTNHLGEWGLYIHNKTSF